MLLSGSLREMPSSMNPPRVVQETLLSWLDRDPPRWTWFLGLLIDLKTGYWHIKTRPALRAIVRRASSHHSCPALKPPTTNQPRGHKGLTVVHTEFYYMTMKLIFPIVMLIVQE